MNEYLTPVNDGQVSDEGSQTAVETEQTVNAENAEVTTGEQEQTVEGSTQTDTDVPATDEQKPHTQTKEENEQFAKVRKEAEARVKAEFEQKQATRDAEFAKRAAQFGWVDSDGNPIKTEDAYWKAVDAQAKLDALITQGKDPEAARAIIERDELKAEREAERQAIERKQREDADAQAFIDFYQKATGEAFTKDTVLPADVIAAMQERNIPLQQAFAEHIALSAREKEKSLALGKQTAEVNAKNATATTGSVTGSPQSDTVTEAEIDAHANDIAWMNKNFKKVEAFYRKSKG